jgi:hypothetical protein
MGCDGQNCRGLQVSFFQDESRCGVSYQFVDRELAVLFWELVEGLFVKINDRDSPALG